MSFNQLYSTIQKNIKGGGFDTMMKTEENTSGEGFFSSRRYSGISLADLASLKKELEKKINEVDQKAEKNKEDIKSLTPSTSTSNIQYPIIPIGTIITYSNIISVSNIFPSANLNIDEMRYKNNALSIHLSAGKKHYTNIPESYLLCDGINIKRGIKQIDDSSAIISPDIFSDLINVIGTSFSNIIYINTGNYVSNLYVNITTPSADINVGWTSSVKTPAINDEITVSITGSLTLQAEIKINGRGAMFQLVGTISGTKMGRVTSGGPGKQFNYANVPVDIVLKDNSIIDNVIIFKCKYPHDFYFDMTAPCVIDGSCVYSHRIDVNKLYDIVVSRESTSIPDLRDLFIRGHNPAKAIDFGVKKEDRIKSHRHYMMTHSAIDDRNYTSDTAGDLTLAQAIDKCSWQYLFNEFGTNKTYSSWCGVNKYDPKTSPVTVYIKKSTLEFATAAVAKPGGTLDAGYEEKTFTPSNYFQKKGCSWIYTAAYHALAGFDNQIQPFLLNNQLDDIKLMASLANGKPATTKIEFNIDTNGKIDASSATKLTITPSDYFDENWQPIIGNQFSHSTTPNANVAATGTSAKGSNYNYDLMYPFVNAEPNSGLTSGVVHGNINASNDKYPIVDSDETYPKHMALTYLIKYK